jgi:hypothetical protein
LVNIIGYALVLVGGTTAKGNLEDLRFGVIADTVEVARGYCYVFYWLAFYVITSKIVLCHCWLEMTVMFR